MSSSQRLELDGWLAAPAGPRKTRSELPQTGEWGEPLWCWPGEADKYTCMDKAELESLRIVGETAAILERMPDSEGARRRRDEAVNWAAERYPAETVAASARISVAEVHEIVGRSVEPTPKARYGLRRPALRRVLRRV
jgi:hypothetical protein